MGPCSRLLLKQDITKQTRSPSTAIYLALRREGWLIVFTKCRGKLQCRSLLSGPLMQQTSALEEVPPAASSMDTQSRGNLDTPALLTLLPVFMEEEWRFLTSLKV